MTVVTIAAGAQLSTNADLPGFRMAGLKVPTGWTAADITFQVSDDGITYGNFYTWDGTTKTLVTIPSANLVAGDWITLVGDVALAMAAYRAVKINSSVNQVAARTISLALAPR